MLRPGFGGGPTMPPSRNGPPTESTISAASTAVAGATAFRSMYSGLSATAAIAEARRVALSTAWSGGRIHRPISALSITHTPPRAPEAEERGVGKEGGRQ